MIEIVVDNCDVAVVEVDYIVAGVGLWQVRFLKSRAGSRDATFTLQARSVDNIKASSWISHIHVHTGEREAAFGLWTKCLFAVAARSFFCQHVAVGCEATTIMPRVVMQVGRTLCWLL